MKIVLFALNGSYSHTCLAVRCLRAPLLRAGFDAVVVEKNLKDRRDEVLQALYAARADVYSFSCYIWNLPQMLDFAADIKGLLPSAKVVLGGPEASFGLERFEKLDFVDHVVVGEGEEALPELCRGLEAGAALPFAVHDEHLHDITGDGILYDTRELHGGEILYYESSRGCPYRCAYCLSSASGALRAKSIAETVDDLRAFERLEGRHIIKFVDRTFNFDAKRANRIWEALLDEGFHHTYHFEICASLLNEESYEILSRFPKGKIQLEIGLQSTNPETLQAVSRHISPSAVIAATQRIHSMGNIHVHLDLIAGLPYETYDRFRISFDEAYYCSDMLQLGFLKLLHGTELRRRAEEYGYVFTSAPPYTVLANRWMSRDELYRLGRISDLLDRYYSSGSFSGCLAAAVGAASSPFAFYEGLLDYIDKQDGRSVRKLSQTDAFRLLFSYVATYLDDEQLSRFEQAMHADFSAREARKLPYSVVENVKKQRQN